VTKSPRHLLIFGATGLTGELLTGQALAAGLEVTACVRDINKLKIEHPQLHIVSGDIMDAASLQSAFSSGADAVACTVGMYHKQPETWLSEGTANIIAGMQSAGLQRIVVVSSLGAGDSAGQGNLLAKAIQKFILSHVLADKTRQEEILARSELDWTIFRPPQLTKEPTVRDDVVLWTGKPPRRKITWKISRASVASYVLDALLTGAHSHQAMNMSDPA